MGRAIDALIAFRLIKLLVTPFNKTQAYKLGIIDDKGKVLIKSKDIDKLPTSNERLAGRKAYTMLIRFVFNLKRLLQKVGIRGPIGTSAAAAIAFFKEEYGNNLEVEREVFKYLKEQGFEYPAYSENYGEPLSEGTYKVKHDIHDLEGNIVINSDEKIDFKTVTDTILGYDVFKYKDVYLTTEDLYVN
ncbi:MAG: hypothetical protein H8D92_01195 [Pelagibacteraceae bacterium]|nr:hypothetical protein [Pelagibacteraceae bacterium]